MAGKHPILGAVSYFEAIATPVLLIGAIALGVAMFVWARNWRRRLADGATTEEHIDSYQHMLEQGLIDPQEFERIQARLGQPPDAPAEPPSAPPTEHP